MLLKKPKAKNAAIKISILFGLLGSLILLGLYFSVLTLVSGWQFTLRQFFTYWYFIIVLALGFGTQVGLYVFLKTKIKANNQSGKIVAVSGTTSTVAMISCCSHYLVNILPVLGAVGFITIISQYQIQLFWVGIIANLIGIIYMGRKVVRIRI
ncbi:MAG: hypothetical protein Q7R31_02395 [Candidatus Levybacteria bacterium]|nr:hypothetical protein [Candidatus Levybacteria bacterium]